MFEDVWSAFDFDGPETSVEDWFSLSKEQGVHAVKILKNCPAGGNPRLPCYVWSLTSKAVAPMVTTPSLFRPSLFLN
jgi:hypothetical protein